MAHTVVPRDPRPELSRELSTTERLKKIWIEEGIQKGVQQGVQLGIPMGSNREFSKIGSRRSSPSHSAPSLPSRLPIFSPSTLQRSRGFWPGTDITPTGPYKPDSLPRQRRSARIHPLPIKTPTSDEPFLASGAMQGPLVKSPSGW